MPKCESCNTKCRPEELHVNDNDEAVCDSCMSGPHVAVVVNKNGIAVQGAWRGKRLGCAFEWGNNEPQNEKCELVVLQGGKS